MPLGGPSVALRDLSEALKAYRIWGYFGLQSIISRYRRSILGPLWIVIGTLVTGIAISFVFGGLFGQPIREVIPQIMGGITVFYFFIVPLNEHPGLFLNAAGYIKSRKFSYMTHVFLSLTTTTIIFAHTLVAFYLLLAAIGVFTVPHWSFVPAIMLVLLFMTFAGTLTGMLGARYRDMSFMLPYIGQIAFFVTPVFWNPGNVEGPRRMILEYNPFYYMLNLTRGPLLGEPARAVDWLVTVGVVAVVFVLWLFFFGAYRKRIVFWI